MDVSQFNPDRLSGIGSKSQQLYELLKTRIQDGTYLDGDRFPPELEVAKALNISRGTVRSAFERLVKEGLCSRRRGNGTFCTAGNRYQQNGRRPATTIFLAVQASKLRTLVHPFFDEILVGIHERAAHRYHLEMGIVSPDCYPENQLSEAAVIILLGHFPEEILERIEQYHKPTISLQFRYRKFSFSSVCVDNEMAGYLLARHLIELGAKNIRYFTRFFDASEFVERAAGVQNALREASLSSGNFLVNLENQPREYLVKTLQQSAADNVDSVIACNDLLAIEILNILDNGLPHQAPMRVAGFDDLQVGSFTRPQLTSVRQPAYQMGESALELAEKLLSKPFQQHLKLLPSLVVRTSSLEGV